MTNHVFAGTQVAWTLLPAFPGTKYSPIWRRSAEGGSVLASVNAGNAAMFVGGGGINLSFEASLGSAVSAQLGTIQTQALAAAQAGTSVSASYTASDPVVLVSVQLPPGAAPAATFPNETVLVDVLSDSAQPHSNPRNAVMLYAVPPDGRVTSLYPDKPGWLASVSRTAGNVVAALAHYNATLVAAYPALKLPTVPTIRMCAIAASIFRQPGATPQEVAEAIYAGMAAEFLLLEQGSVAHGITLVEFENGDGGFRWL